MKSYREGGICESARAKSESARRRAGIDHGFLIGKCCKLIRSLAFLSHEYLELLLLLLIVIYINAAADRGRPLNRSARHDRGPTRPSVDRPVLLGLIILPASQFSSVSRELGCLVSAAAIACIAGACIPLYLTHFLI